MARSEGPVAIVLLDKWTWGPWEAYRCPKCGCDPDHPCEIVLDDGSKGCCAPAGAFGQTSCTSCRFAESVERSKEILASVLRDDE